MRKLMLVFAVIGLTIVLAVPFFVAPVLVAPALATPVLATVDPVQLGKAVTEIEFLDQMRSGLASGLEDTPEEPTIATFMEVCAPVGQQAATIAQENGWQVRQVALKYRNPAHKPQDAVEVEALAQLAEHPNLKAFWQEENDGVHYFRRINIEASCLACHGAKNQRPAFIQDKYPEDLAYDFQVGDLRGLYEVIIPALQ
jgi:Protein of unknown function (DUF3365)